MQSIGLFDEERLTLIPAKYWKAHEFCFYLHDQMVAMLHQYDESGAHNLVLDAFLRAVGGKDDKFDVIDFLELLKEKGLTEEYRHYLTSNVTLALIADMLNFLFESLSAFEKRKFTVGFSLLRKPLQENLMYLSWILADEKDFVGRFEAKNYETLKLNRLSKERRVELIKGAIDCLATNDAFDAEMIWTTIFSKKYAGGFEPALQKATHLITSMGDLLQTLDYSFNFIFEDPRDDEYYKFLYSNLPYLLLYYIQIALAAFNKISAVNNKTYNHLVLTTMGCYEALFLDSKAQHIGHMLNSTLRDILICTHCDARIRITKKSAPQIYLTERIVCRNCGLLTQVPLHWLLAKAKLKVVPDKEGDK